MKLKVSNSDILMLEKNKNALLLLEMNKNALLLSTNTCKLFAIGDFTIEEEVIVKKKWYSKKSKSIGVKQQYLTKIEINSWNTTGKFLGILNDEASVEFLHNDIYQMRKNWLDFKEMLKGFGMEVLKIVT